MVCNYFSFNQVILCSTKHGISNVNDWDRAVTLVRFYKFITCLKSFFLFLVNLINKLIMLKSIRYDPFIFSLAAVEKWWKNDPDSLLEYN